MADRTKSILGTLIIVLLLSGVVYVSFYDDVKIRVDEDKTTFYSKIDGRFKVAAREYNNLFEGTSKKYRDVSEITISTATIGDKFIVTRVTPYKAGPTIVDTYVFDGSNTDIEKFPLEHQVEIYNGNGFIYQYEVRDLQYEGPTIRNPESPLEFGYNIKVEWDDQNYWSTVYKSGIVKVRFRPDSDYEVYKVRVFDPPKDKGESLSPPTKLIEPSVTENYRVTLATGAEKYLYNVDINGRQICLNILNETITKDITDEKGTVKTRFQVPSSISVKNINKVEISNLPRVGDNFCYTLPENIDFNYMKLGENSIIINADTIFPSVDINITQENKFAHLSISNATADGLEVYLPFYTNQSTTAYDHTNPGSDFVLGTFDVAAWNRSNSPVGTGGYKLGNDGNTLNTTMMATYTGTLQYPITMEFWHQQDDGIATFNHDSFIATIFDQSDTGQKLELRLVNSRPQIEISNSGAAVHGSNLDPNTWYHVVARMVSATNRSIWVNGVQSAQSVVNVAFPTGVDTILLGSSFGGGGNTALNGTLTGFKLYNRSLSDDEILAASLSTQRIYDINGTMDFYNIDLGNNDFGGLNNTINVHLPFKFNKTGTTLSANFEDGPWVPFDDNGTVTNLTGNTTTNNNNITLRIRFSSNGLNQYSPIIENNFTIDSYNVTYSLDPALGDSTPPTFSAYLNTSDTFRKNDDFNSSALLTDGIAVSDYIFGTNATGSWLNTSLVGIGGTSSNVTSFGQISTIGGVRGDFIGWRFYGNDTSNNLAQSIEQFFIVQNTLPTTTVTISASDASNTVDTNLTAANVSTEIDRDGGVKNIFNWIINGSSFEEVILPFEKINGTDTNNSQDYSGNNHAFTTNNSVVWNGTGGYDGKGAYMFDGVDDFVEVSSQLVSDYPFTMSAWVNPIAQNGSGVILSMTYSSSSTSWLGIRLRDGNATLMAREGGSILQNVSQTNMQPGTWTHLTAVFTSDTNKTLYVDGEPSGQIVQSIDYNVGTDKFTVGRLSDLTPSSYANATIDEVLLYNRSLSHAQIRFLAQNKTNQISYTETSSHEAWKVIATPNDGYEDGALDESNTIVIDVGTTACVVPASGDWVVDLSLNCYITASGDMDGSDIIFSGTGSFTLDGAEVRNWGNILVSGASSARIKSVNGGGFK